MISPVPSPLAAGRPLYALAAGVLASGAAGLVPEADALFLGALCATAGALRSLAELRRLRRLREAASRELVLGGRPDFSPLLSWRAEEVASRSNRRLLARGLHEIVLEVQGRIPTRFSIVNREAARREADVIEELARRLDEPGRPVSPRGLLLVEALLRDGRSPLYVRERAGDLRPSLEQCLRALEADQRRRRDPS